MMMLLRFKLNIFISSHNVCPQERRYQERSHPSAFNFHFFKKSQSQAILHSVLFIVLINSEGNPFVKLTLNKKCLQISPLSVLRTIPIFLNKIQGH